MDSAKQNVVAAGVLNDLGARVLLVFGSANHLHQIGLHAFVFFVTVVAVDKPAERAAQQMDTEDGAGSDQREHQMSRGRQHTYRRRAPERGGRIETPYVNALTQ